MQLQPWLLGTSNISADDEEFSDGQSNTLISHNPNFDEGDVEEADLILGASNVHYRPIGEVVVKLVRYLLEMKKIPLKVPLYLTVQKEYFKKR